MDLQATEISFVEQIFKRMKKWGTREAIRWGDVTLSYDQFVDAITAWEQRLAREGVSAGTVCALYSDFTPQTCACMFALMNRGAVLVPLTKDVNTEMDHLMDLAGTEVLYRFDENDNASFERRSPQARPNLVAQFLERRHSGLIVFTSGSTGTPKGILHDCEAVMKKFVKVRSSWRTLLFLLLDHFGGINTLFSVFAYGGTAICLTDRSVDGVVKTIAKTKADLIPTTPTFLNLLIAGGFYHHHDLSSVKFITYGTEMMTPATLQKVSEVFPHASLKQTYGMSELGVLQSKSQDKNSLWLKVGGEGFQTKIKDNILWVKSEANMVGYLNAPNPFDAEGWLCTGDEVEVEGDLIRFKGRKSEIINVGGKKVFPAEVEDVILSAENIKDVTVFGVKHPLMGQVVNSKITLRNPEDPQFLTERLRKHCNEKLAKYKVPLRFILVEPTEDHHNARFKKDRMKNG